MCRAFGVHFFGPPCRSWSMTGVLLYWTVRTQTAPHPPFQGAQFRGGGGIGGEGKERADDGWFKCWQPKSLRYCAQKSLCCGFLRIIMTTTMMTLMMMKVMKYADSKKTPCLSSHLRSSWLRPPYRSPNLRRACVRRCRRTARPQVLACVPTWAV